MNAMRIIGFLLLLVAVRADNECKCFGTVLDGSNRTPILTMNYPNLLGCDEAAEVACKEKCATRATNEGDLNARPSQLGGLTLGDFVCMKVSDVSNAQLTVYAQVCQSDNMETGITGKQSICCNNKVKSEC